MSNDKTANTFVDILEKIWDACGTIEEAGGCDRCPLRNVACLESDKITELANFASKGTIAEFLDFAEDIEQVANERDFDAYMEERRGESWED